MEPQTQISNDPKPSSLFKRLAQNAVIAPIFCAVWWYYDRDETKAEILALWLCVTLGSTIGDYVFDFLWYRFKAWRSKRAGQPEP